MQTLESYELNIYKATTVVIYIGQQKCNDSYMHNCGHLETQPRPVVVNLALTLLMHLSGLSTKKLREQSYHFFQKGCKVFL